MRYKIKSYNVLIFIHIKFLKLIWRNSFCVYLALSSRSILSVGDYFSRSIGAFQPTTILATSESCSCRENDYNLTHLASAITQVMLMEDGVLCFQHVRLIWSILSWKIIDSNVRMMPIFVSVTTCADIRLRW